MDLPTQDCLFLAVDCNEEPNNTLGWTAVIIICLVSTVCCGVTISAIVYLHKKRQEAKIVRLPDEFDEDFEYPVVRVASIPPSGYIPSATNHYGAQHDVQVMDLSTDDTFNLKPGTPSFVFHSFPL